PYRPEPAYFRSLDSDDYSEDEHYIANYKPSNKKKPMLKIKDLHQMKINRGIGQKKDSVAEEKVGHGVQSRSPGVQKRSPKDALGRSMSQSNCGQSSDLAERIVGGTDASEGSHPWIVAILKNGEPWCGGSIINHEWVRIHPQYHYYLDDPPETSSWAIRVGTNNRNNGPTYKIKKVITHERFNLDGMLNSDIAMMKVAKEIKFSNNVKPVCLPDNSYDEPLTMKMIVAGWGAVKFDDDNLPVKLQDVTLNLVKDADCAQKYKEKKYTLYKSQLCTWNYKQDACQGDSGGPMVEIGKHV
ncbi:unnamed protein product, partial [Medioppia subpectinata]